MTDTICAACTRPVPDNAYVCTPCALRLEQALGDVPAIADELETTITRQARITAGDGRRPTGDRPLPYHQTAAIVRDALHNTLATWIRVIADHPDVHDGLPADTLAAMARWLLRHVEWLRHHEAGPEAVDEITAAIAEAWRVIDQPPDRWYAGPCGNADEATGGPCPQDLYARPGAARVRCRACGTVYDVRERREWLLATAEDVLAHAVLISQALSRLDQPVTPERIRQWAHRGRLVAHGVDAQGRPLYRVGDVLDLLAPAVERVAS